MRRTVLGCYGRCTSGQLESESAASASSVRTGDRSQLAELCCSNMFSRSVPPLVAQHLPLQASSSHHPIPSRAVLGRCVARLGWAASCRLCQQKGPGSAARPTAAVVLQVTQMCFKTSVLMRCIHPNVTPPEGRMAETRCLVFLQGRCRTHSACFRHG